MTKSYAALFTTFLFTAFSAYGQEMSQEEVKARYDASQYILWSHRCAKTYNDPGLIEFAKNRSLQNMASAGIAAADAEEAVSKLTRLAENSEDYSVDDCEFSLPSELLDRVKN